MKSFGKIAASLATLMISVTPLAAATKVAQPATTGLNSSAIQALGGKLRMSKKLQRKNNQVAGAGAGAAGGAGGAGAGAGAAGAAAGAGAAGAGAAAAGGLSTLGIAGVAAGAAAAAGGIAAATSSSSSP